jgi:hypothetical protein
MGRDAKEKRKKRSENSAALHMRELGKRRSA